MSVIGYLTSKTAELRVPLQRGVDSIGIKWTGEVEGGKVPEPEPQNVPETLRRALGWK